MKKSLIDRIEELERAAKPDYSQYIADMVERLNPIDESDDTGMIELCSVSFEEWSALSEKERRALTVIGNPA